MNLRTHIIDTIKEWQIKIGYREGKMKLYYPGESLAALLGILDKDGKSEITNFEIVLNEFCRSCEPELGQISISGNWERYCLTISEKGCAYVAERVGEPEFLKLFLKEITKRENSPEQIRRCFAEYAQTKNTLYKEDRIENSHHTKSEGNHAHGGAAFYFEDARVDEYVYWVEENEFGLNYHRFTREEYKGFF